MAVNAIEPARLRRPRPFDFGILSESFRVPSVEWRFVGALMEPELVDGPGLEPDRPRLPSAGRRVGDDGAESESTGRSAPWKGPDSGASKGVVGTETEVPRAPKSDGCTSAVLIVEIEVSM